MHRHRGSQLSPLLFRCDPTLGEWVEAVSQ